MAKDARTQDIEGLYKQAKQLVLEAGKASTAHLQRKLKIGYARAAKLMDLLEERGVIGPADGAKPRDVIGAGNTDDLAKEPDEDDSEDEPIEPEPPKPDRRPGGRPPKFASEDEYQRAIDDYKDAIRELRQVPNKAGFCYYVRISRDTYNEYRERYPDAHKELEEFIENAWVQRLAGTTPTGAIFYLKNAFKDDYKDRHENDVKLRPSSLSKDDIGAAIAQLPPEQQDALYVHLAAVLTGGNTGGKA